MAKNPNNIQIEHSFSPEQIKLVKSTIAKNATDDELKLFLYQAQRTGLDPLTRQIYFVKRGTQVNIQTSIDGFRIIAERSGQYAGQDAPIFEEGHDGKPLKCSVTVYKFSPNGERYKAAVGVAYWSEYKPNPGQDFMWNKMPHTMLAKVAESLALRKAFPQDLSGIYTTEEMDQIERDDNTVDETLSNSPTISTKQKSQIQAERVRLEMNNDDLIKFTKSLGIKNPYDMNKKDADILITALANLKEQEK